MSAQGTYRFYFVSRQTILLVNEEPLGRERAKWSFNLLEKIQKSKRIMGVYWNLPKKTIKLTMRYSNGPQKTTSKTLAA